MFQLNEDEIKNMVSQNAIPSRKHLGGHKLYVFTQEEISMLLSVLRNKKAININIQIMRTFILMKNFIQENMNLINKISEIWKKQLLFQIETDKKFKEIFNELSKTDIKPSKGIFYDGEIFDAYVFLSKLIKTAKKEIMIIDNYIDEDILILFSKINKNIKITFSQR